MAVTRSAKATAEGRVAKATPGGSGGTSPAKRKRQSSTTAKRTSDKVEESNPEEQRFFLFKSEGETRMQNGHDMKFSIDDLAKEKNSTTHWDGVRNYEARNCMQRMKLGDKAFFYHSNTKVTRPGIVGIVEVCKEAYPDFTAWDKSDPHFDPKSPESEPKWFMVDVCLVRKFPRCVTLDEIKNEPRLQQMMLVRRGRVSVQTVRENEWQCILEMAE